MKNLTLLQIFKIIDVKFNDALENKDFKNMSLLIDLKKEIIKVSQK